MSKVIDLSHIYNLRNNFTIIGLTGQIGSGCSEIAEQLSKGFNNNDFESPFEIGIDKKTAEIEHNSYRKYRIVYNYAKENFKGYSRINYKDVLVIFLLQNSYENFIGFLESEALNNEMKVFGIDDDFNIEIGELNKLKEQFEALSIKIRSIDIQNLKSNNKLHDLFEFYFKSEFIPFCNSIHAVLKNKSRIKRNKLLQIVSTNLRKSGKPFEFAQLSADNIFTIVELINYIIKSYRKSSRGSRTQIVIDDLRNPIEIMYFKQRFAAFYTISVNRDEESKKNALNDKYKSPDNFDIAKKLFKEEYDEAKSHEFYKANISACIQQADIHISFITRKEIDKINEISERNSSNNQLTDNTSPYFSWQIQLLKYVSLISHPGLITPSPEERCMQMAYTAKHNSGCISRHVGAAITDKDYSIKAIGWNNTPMGQVPCVLRNTEDLLDNKNDLKSFTQYEITNSEFFVALGGVFRNQIKDNRENLNGRNVSFCFKDVKNISADGKNQVHTRSLHAEESAFLQITKYGGVGIENGKLFTTASPCELCSKKAYQLGIKDIYFIDPYPGISDDQILSAGNKPIKPRLFNGAIGNAYHWLYDPIMPYKDELTLLLGNKFDDYATKQKCDAEKHKNENDELKKQIEKLKQENEQLKNNNA